MRYAICVLAVATLAVKLALLFFGAAVERALMTAHVTPQLLYTTINLVFGTLLVVTAAIGIYAAGREHRGGWIALFCGALVLGLYGPFFAGMAVPFVRITGPGFMYIEGLDAVLQALVPLVALAYALRGRSLRAVGAERA